MQTPYGYKAVVAAFGQPATPDGTADTAWAAANLVRIPVPWQMRTAWSNEVVTQITVHKLVAPAFQAAFRDIYSAARLLVKKQVGFDKTTAEYDRLTQALLNNLGLSMFGGTYNVRPVRGGTQLSMHAFGIAIDIDPKRNPLGATSGAMPMWVVEIFEKHGFLWGGHYQGRKDWMHFQFAKGC